MEVYDPRPLLPVEDISLSNDDPQLNADLSLVARSATQEFSTLFSAPPPAGTRPVTICYRAEGPMTDSIKDTTRYIVYLSVAYWDPARLVYQLAHELCHVFTDPRRHNWFVESCCAMASTVLLCRMAELWANSPPPVNRKMRPLNFRHYAQKVIRDARKAQKPTWRQGKDLNAEILRPLFDESSHNWNALRFLGQASTCPPADLTDWNDRQRGFSFERWLQAVPPYLNDIVRRISNIPEDCWDYRMQP
jgi:hypothetical protein